MGDIAQTPGVPHVLEQPEAEHAKLREGIAGQDEGTGPKDLICPEMTYQMDIILPRVYDPPREGVASAILEGR